MKPIALVFFLCALLIAPVAAYSLYLDAPAEVYAGQTVKVTGNSSFPAGTSFDLVFYEAKYTSTQIERKTITLQDYNNKTFVASFSTKGLAGGQYKVEVQFDSRNEEKLSSDSQTLKLVQVLDRSGEITLSAPLVQALDEALRVEGSIAKLGDSGVQVEVRGPQGPVFGPTWIETKKDLKTGDGAFARKIPVSIAGDYDVHFTDAKGYIGVETITVSQPVTVPTTSVTTPVTARTTRVPTTTATPTQSPPSSVIVLVSLGITAGVVLAIDRKKQD